MHRCSIRRLLITTILLAAIAGSALAIPLEWRPEDGGNGHYYELIAGGNLGWQAARDAAAARAWGGRLGHLATITSAAEQAWIYQTFVPTYCWIGGYQPAGSPEPAGGWTWVTGEPWSYTHWGSGEPNNEANNEPWLEIRTGGFWNDEKSYYTRDWYLVEFDTPGEDPDQVVEAWVFEAGTDKPLGGVPVTLIRDGADRFQVKTDPDGLARFQGVPIGLFGARADDGTHQCYGSGETMANSTCPVIMKLPTRHEVTGRVHDARTGAPLTGAQVTLLDAAEQPLFTTTVKDRGDFYLNVLDPGDYSLLVEFRKQAGTVAEPQHLYRPVVSAPFHLDSEDLKKDVGDISLVSNTVVLVHGIYADSSIWNDEKSGMASALRQAGFAVVDDLDLGKLGLTKGVAHLTSQAKQLADALDDLQLRSFDVVAHSQGGLVTRHLLENTWRGEAVSRVRRLVTLGTPHHGSPIASSAEGVLLQAAEEDQSVMAGLTIQTLVAMVRGLSPSLGDLEPDSDFLRTLNQGSDTIADWSGRCDEAPAAERQLRPDTEYLAIAGDAPSGGLVFLMGGMAMATESGCDISDGVVPAISARLHAVAPNVHNAAYAAHHKSDTQGLYVAPEVQAAVAAYLDDGSLPAWTSIPGVSDQWSRIALRAPVIPNNVSHAETVSLDDGAGIRFFWQGFDGYLSVTLRSPSGTVLTRDNAALDPDFEFEEDLAKRRGWCRVMNAETGDWTITVTPVFAESSTQTVVVWADARLALEMTPTIQTVSAASHDDRLLTVSLQHGTQPVLDAAVRAELFSPLGQATTLALYDLGIEPDQTAGDGIYTGLADILTEYSGVTSVEFVAEGTTPLPFSRQSLQIIETHGETDLSLGGSRGFAAVSASGRVFDEVFLEARVTNLGDAPVTCEAEFRHLESDSVLARAAAILQPGASDLFRGLHLPTVEGLHHYEVRVRPLDGSAESSWADNWSAASILVGPSVTGVPDLDGDEQAGRSVAAAGIRGAHPNPFNPTVTLRLAVPKDGPASLKVFDVQGRHVRTLLDGPLQAGVRDVTWNGTDDRARPLPSGVYIAVLKTGGTRSEQKMVLLK